MTDRGVQRTAIGLLAVIAFIMVGWALRATMVVTMPLAFAFFLAALLHPVQSWLDERLPGRLRWLSIGLAMLLILAVLALFFGAIWFGAGLLSSRVPQLLDQFQGQAEALRQWGERHGLPVPADGRADGAGGSVASGAAQAATWLLQRVELVVSVLLLIFFYTLLMLIEARRWGRKVAAVEGRSWDGTWRAIVMTVAVRLRQYLLIRTLVGLLTAVMIAGWLLLVGMDLVFLWAILQFVLNYVPTLGSIVAGTFPAVYALVQFGAGKALLVIGGIVLIEQVMGNYVDPRLQGRTLDISPLVVLVSIVFWGWVWGVAGALLAVPLTATIMIVCAHIPALEPVALVLSGSADRDALRAQAGVGRAEQQDQPGLS